MRVLYADSLQGDCTASDDSSCPTLDWCPFNVRSLSACIVPALHTRARAHTHTPHHTHVLHAVSSWRLPIKQSQWNHCTTSCHRSHPGCSACTIYIRNACGVCYAVYRATRTFHALLSPTAVVPYKRRHQQLTYLVASQPPNHDPVPRPCQPPLTARLLGVPRCAPCARARARARTRACLCRVRPVAGVMLYVVCVLSPVLCWYCVMQCNT